MKTLIVKAVLPCLALLVLISAKPIEPVEPFSKKIAASKMFGLPTNYIITNGDGGNCLNPGARTLCVSWTGGTLSSIRLNVSSGFSITSANPVNGSSGFACWTINVNPTGQVLFSFSGKETVNDSFHFLINSCIKACAEPEECE